MKQLMENAGGIPAVVCHPRRAGPGSPDGPREFRQTAHPDAHPDGAPSLDFDDEVGFDYGPGEPQAFRAASASRWSRGHTRCSWWGRSGGAGKTTCANLMIAVLGPLRRLGTLGRTRHTRLQAGRLAARGSPWCRRTPTCSTPSIRGEHNAGPPRRYRGRDGRGGKAGQLP